MLQLIFAFLLGAAIVLSALLFLPKLVDKYLTRKNKTYEITFKIDYYRPGSLYSPSKGTLVKSPPITVNIKASGEHEALALLDDIIKEETKGELVRIREIKEKEPKQA